MLTPELKSFIRAEIAKQMNVLLSAVAGENTVTDETIQLLYPGSADLLKRPKMQPYGFASRARLGTISVVGKQGENPGNRIVLGHRDAEAPTDLELGESRMYSEEGYQLGASVDGVYIGKDAADIPLLLGTITNETLGELIELIQNHVHGPPGSPPTTAAQFALIKTEKIDTNALLSTASGGLA